MHVLTLLVLLQDRLLLFGLLLGLLGLVLDLLQFTGIKADGVGIVRVAGILERLLVEVQQGLDSDGGTLLVEPVGAELVLQAEQAHVGLEGHLPHAVSVKVELILDNLGEVSVNFVTFFHGLAKLSGSLVG